MSKSLSEPIILYKTKVTYTANNTGGSSPEKKKKKKSLEGEYEIYGAALNRQQYQND